MPLSEDESKFFFCLGGQITYHGIAWRDSAENVTARCHLITEIYIFGIIDVISDGVASL